MSAWERARPHGGARMANFAVVRLGGLRRWRRARLAFGPVASLVGAVRRKPLAKCHYRARSSVDRFPCAHLDTGMPSIGPALGMLTGSSPMRVLRPLARVLNWPQVAAA